jgi:hypothetical protein
MAVRIRKGRAMTALAGWHHGCFEKVVFFLGVVGEDYAGVGESVFDAVSRRDGFPLLKDGRYKYFSIYRLNTPSLCCAQRKKEQQPDGSTSHSVLFA